jgi:hypothetical protein
MNDNQPLTEGDRVRRRCFPNVQGYVFSMHGLYPGWISVQWDDPEEIADVRNPRRDLEKLPHPAATPPARLHPV